MESNFKEFTCMLCQNIITLEGEDHLTQFDDLHGVNFNSEFIYIASLINTEERTDAVITANRGTKGSAKTNKSKEGAKNVNKCSKCKVTFTRPWSLKNHMKMHNVAKQFKCDDLVICHRKKGPKKWI